MRFLATSLYLLACVFAPGASAQADFGSQPLRLLVPAPPGSGADIANVAEFPVLLVGVNE